MNQDFYWRAVAVTPNDDTDLANPSKALYVGGAGNVAATMQDGSTVTFTGLLVGTVYRLRIKRIKATGTTATNLIALR